MTINPRYTTDDGREALQILNALVVANCELRRNAITESEYEMAVASAVTTGRRVLNEAYRREVSHRLNQNPIKLSA